LPGGTEAEACSFRVKEYQADLSRDQMALAYPNEPLFGFKIPFQSIGGSLMQSGYTVPYKISVRDIYEYKRNSSHQDTIHTVR